MLISNLMGTVRMARKIADGDLTVRVKVLSEKDLLGKSLMQMVKTIKRIVRDINYLTDTAMEGKLDTRGDAENCSNRMRMKHRERLEKIRTDRKKKLPHLLLV